jgi:hypothetical protein
MKGYGEVRILTLALDGYQQPTLRPGRPTPEEEPRYAVNGRVWAPELVWTFWKRAKSLAHALEFQNRNFQPEHHQESAKNLH